MKKDVVSAIVSVMIVGASTALGILMLGRSDMSESAVTEKNYSVAGISEKAVTTLLSETAEPGTETDMVTSVSESKITTSAAVTTSVTVISTEAVTTVSETVTTVEPVTEAPEQTEPSEKQETEASQEQPPEVQNPDPQPEPEPERQPDPVPEPEPEAVPTAPDSATEFQRELYRLVNELRVESGVKPLLCSDVYNYAAQIRAEEIVTVFEHRRPDGREWETIFTDTGANGGYTGENIAAGSGTPQDVFNQWMGSEYHKANMLKSEYKIIGIGYCCQQDSTYGHYWVQLFG